MCAAEAYTIPVQIAQQVSPLDVIWYIYTCSELAGGNRPSFEKIAHKLEVYRTHFHQEFKFRGLVAQCVEDDEARWRANSVDSWWYGKEEREVYPTKKEGYDHKINLWFQDVWHDCIRCEPRTANVWQRSRGLSDGMHNDTATGWLLWLCASVRVLESVGFLITELMWDDVAVLKKFNTLLKSMGLQAGSWGSLCVELQSLSGRGVARLKPLDDIRPRIDKRRYEKEKGVALDMERLEECIKEVISQEMLTKPEWGDVDDYWSRRWAYTKAGSHSRYAETEWFDDRLDLPPQPTRREFAENVKENVVALGEPRVDAGFSEKLEHGKTRAIYGCDSRSYYTFDYLLKPVEAVWSNSRVLLDPGLMPQCVLYKELSKIGACKYMIDFDDFNSQHSIEAMQLCTRLCCEGAPQEILDWAVESWAQMFVHWGSGERMSEARMVGTLPSGHRATTFINTVLNAAYCRYALGDLYRKLRAYHVGDDVVMGGHEWDISEAVIRTTESPFRINPAKQSVGLVCGEFLRVAFTDSEAVGYAARAISSLVSGNWVTQTAIDKRAYVETLIRGTWTISARSRCHTFGALCVTSLSRWVPVMAPVARDVLLHRISVEATPVTKRSTFSGVSVIRLSGGRAPKIKERKRGTYATDAYMSQHVDHKLLEEAGVSPGLLRSAMLEASYKPRSYASSTQITASMDRAYEFAHGALSTLMSGTFRTHKGLTDAMDLLRSVYRDVDWRRLVSIVRGVSNDTMSTTGKCSWPVLSNYSLPFSDCMHLLSRITMCTAVHSEYPVMV